MISSQQDSNIGYIFNQYGKVNTPVSTLTSSSVSSLLGNYSEAVTQDETIREWLNSLNVTRFKASYNLAEFSLHKIVLTIYQQFPSPPAYRNESNAIVFLNSSFTQRSNFTNWFESYKIFYDDVSPLHSKINNTIAGISQAYLDSATLQLQTLDYLQKNNLATARDVESFGEMITHDKAMATYNPSIFQALDSIYSSGTNSEAYIEQYKLGVEQYNVLY